MALFSKGIYRIENKLLLTEKFAASLFKANMSWTYKQTMGFLLMRPLKLRFDQKNSDFDFIDHLIFVDIKIVCSKVLLTEMTILKWIAEDTEIKTQTTEKVMKVDIISFHTFLQKSYARQRKYCDDYYDYDSQFSLRK